jgi:cyclic pyranopterin phosphate synthase
METVSTQLIDDLGRRLNYLRISITDRCNFNCIYCMPKERLEKLQHEDILTYEEIFRLVSISASLGVEKIRLTGGEPMVRSGFCDFLSSLTSISGLKDISLTTNGFFLKNKIQKIKDAGIKRINISLDTLNRKKFKTITGHDSFDKVWEGIELASRLGFAPIKINMVVMKGMNDDEVADMAGLSLRFPFHIRFIEYMPIGLTNHAVPFGHISNADVKKSLEKIGNLVQVPRTHMDGPTVRYKFEGAPGEIGFISPLTNHFCHTCNRLRLTANGKLRPCLLSNKEEDIKGPMRKGASDEELIRIFLETAHKKPRGHEVSPDETVWSYSGEMSAIGG